MDLRPATPADADGIAAVARESWHAAYGDFLSAETIDATVDAWYDPQGLREQVMRGHCHVATESGRIVAFVHATADIDGTAVSGTPELAGSTLVSPSGERASGVRCSRESRANSETRVTTDSARSSSRKTRSVVPSIGPEASR